MTTRRTVDRHGGHGRDITIIEEREVVPPRYHAETAAGEEEMVAYHPSGSHLARAWARTFSLWIALLAFIAEVLLGFRLAFALAGANPANGFVDFIYDTTGPFVAPFESIANERVSDSGVFEPETVIAMAVYAIAALIFVMLLNVATSAPSLTGEREVVQRERRTHYTQQ